MQLQHKFNRYQSTRAAAVLLSLVLVQAKGPLCDECFPDGKEVRIIDREHLNRGTADYRSRDQFGSCPREMPTPLVLPRVEQAHDLPCDGISSGDIRTFVPIAVHRQAKARFARLVGPPCCCAMI